MTWFITSRISAEKSDTRHPCHSVPMDGELHVVVRGFVNLCALATAAFCLYCTYLAFAGGVVPIFGWELEGSAGAGFTWMLFVTPLITTVGYWVAMIIALPLGAIFKADA